LTVHARSCHGCGGLVVFTIWKFQPRKATTVLHCTLLVPSTWSWGDGRGGKNSGSPQNYCGSTDVWATVPYRLLSIMLLSH